MIMCLDPNAVCLHFHHRSYTHHDNSQKRRSHTYSYPDRHDEELRDVLSREAEGQLCINRDIVPHSSIIFVRRLESSCRLVVQRVPV